MSLSEKLLKEAMGLKAYEKIFFIEALIRNLNNDDPETHSMWIDESFKRLQKYNKNKAKSFTYEEVFG